MSARLKNNFQGRGEAQYGSLEKCHKAALTVKFRHLKSAKLFKMSESPVLFQNGPMGTHEIPMDPNGNFAHGGNLNPWISTG